MKRHFYIALLLSLLFSGCARQEKSGEVIHREFYQAVWERFDYANNEIEVAHPTTFDLGLRISFTDEYPYETISLVFSVFTSDNTPYRSKGYKFRVKDTEGHWSSDCVDGCYIFDLPINKAMEITEADTYRFQIEQTMPITPLVGVKELVLYDKNNKNT